MATNSPINPRAVDDMVVVDELPPEIAATAMAMLSRNAHGSTQTLKKAAASDGSFIERYYVGYNHRSIGDCGSTSIYVNGCSILCAKAIEDSRRFDGQESSTRYLELGTEMPVDPLARPEMAKAQADLLRFYRDAQEDVLADVMEAHPPAPGAKPAEWRRACEARRFDILRGFLPAGIQTNVGWHTTLSHAAEHLDFLRHHPLQEVREVAAAMLRKLAAKYPHTFFEPGTQGDEKAARRSLEAEEYLSTMGGLSAYAHIEAPERLSTRVDIDKQKLEPFLEALAKRPMLYPAPERFNRFGSITLRGRMDFGSHRDLQRHRGAHIPMPMLDLRLGFHPWYLDALPENWRQRALDLLGAIERTVGGLDARPEDVQYLVPLGTLIPFEAVGGISAMVYIAERRSDKTVHPTLRPVAQHLGKAIAEWEPRLRLHVDHDAENWTERRGRQTILEKPAPLSPSPGLDPGFFFAAPRVSIRPWKRSFRIHPRATSRSTDWMRPEKAPSSTRSMAGPRPAASRSSTRWPGPKPTNAIPAPKSSKAWTSCFSASRRK